MKCRQCEGDVDEERYSLCSKCFDELKTILEKRSKKDKARRDKGERGCKWCWKRLEKEWPYKYCPVCWEQVVEKASAKRREEEEAKSFIKWGN